MSETNTAQLAMSINAQVVGASGQATITGAIQFPSFLNLALSNGVGAGKINQIFANTYAVANGTPLDLDLYALGGGNDLVGNAYTMAVGKILIIQNLGVTGTPSESDAITIGGDSTTAAWTSFLSANTAAIILPGPSSATLTPTFLVSVPGDTAYTIGASTTNHKLQIASTNSGKTVNVSVILLGSTGT